MSFSVIPGHVLKYPLLTSFEHVSCTRLNAAACRYLMEFSLTLTWCKWLLLCVGLSRIWRGILQKPVIMSLVPCNTTCLSLVTAIVCLLKLASHSASHNFPIDMRELCPTPGSMCDSISPSGKVANSSLHPSVDCRIGCFTWIGATGYTARSWVASTFSYCTDAPVSAIADALLRDVDGCNTEYRLFTSLSFSILIPLCHLPASLPPVIFFYLPSFGGLLLLLSTLGCCASW